jgi:hypothetical protein
VSGWGALAAQPVSRRQVAGGTQLDILLMITSRINREVLKWQGNRLNEGGSFRRGRKFDS